MRETPTIRTLLAKTREWLSKKGIDGARLDAELLLAHALSETRIKLYMDIDRPLGEEEVARYRALVVRRGAHEPIAYITGSREFFGIDILVEPGVLVPRPETEHLVEEALARLPEGAEGVVVDACTGSGCVAIAIAHARPSLVVHATDVSEKAVAVATKNVERAGLVGRVIVHQGDLLTPVSHERSVLGVVANPPYVRREVYATLMPDVRDHEPAVALVGEGEDALGHHRRILDAAHAMLRDRGFVALEIGADQEREARALSRAGLEVVDVARDLSGHPRIAIFARHVEPTPHASPRS